jgi:hypothetical protein
LVGRAKFFPKPAEFLELLEASRGVQATAAWLDVVAALKRYGNYQSVRFADPVIHSVIEAMGGWVSLGLMAERERTWRQKEFERLYSVLVGQDGRHPAYLAGLHEIQNACGGHPVQQVIDVAGRSRSDALPQSAGRNFKALVRLQGGQEDREGGGDEQGEEGDRGDDGDGHGDGRGGDDDRRRHRDRRDAPGCVI